AFLGDELDANLDEIPNHRLDVTPDVADFGELRGLDLQERRVCQPGQPAGDFGLADAGRADHENVLRNDFFGQFGRQALTTIPVPQGDGDGAFGGRLPHDELVELGDDLPRRQGLVDGWFSWCQ